MTELADDLARFGEERGKPLASPRMVAEAMVTLVFNQGAEALDANRDEREQLRQRLKTELRMVLLGSQVMARRQRTTQP